jgi:UDP-N-acetylglucosamine 2-epimerase (hydrolysing)
MLEGNHRFATFPSISFERFLVLLKNSEFILGNSSAGIREAPFYGVPTVNVGTRQNRRHFSHSIVNCGYAENQIHDAINQALKIGPFKATTDFGEGNSTKRFAAAVHSPDFWQTKFQKEFKDIELCASPLFQPVQTPKEFQEKT